MKRWGIFIFIFLLLGYAAVLAKEHFQEKQENNLQNNYGNQGLSLENSKTLKIVPKDQVHQGDLLLVNKNYSVHKEGIPSDIVNVSEHQELLEGYIVLDHNILLSKHVVQEFQKMVKAADKDSVNHFLISSGYRDFEKQEELYKQKGAAYALPAGYSEHNVGLSLDIGSTQAEMSKAEEGTWLEKNAWKFGFILRYPKDKADLTGIQYEPWHFRYVGLPHSAIIQENDWVLEQYLDFVKEKKSLSTVVEGKAYNVSYYSMSQNMIRVPENGRYEISGNNTNGVIVTVEK